MMEESKLDPGILLQNRYRILSLLGRGGMGMVYLAEDLRFQSKVAVKEACFTQEKLRKAFAREAELLNRLRHPSLPHVTDHFKEGEGQYLVMQFIPGKDLEELLAERKRKTGEAFAVEQVLGWADELLDVLEYLHGHQPPVVHRDIKPQNLKLTENGEVILLDFGLAKGAAPDMSQAGTSLHGYTCHYAPLEQMRGSGTDPRSDLYALAATIYRLVTGHLPPDALTRAAAMLERRPDPLLPVNKLNAQVPEAVAAVLTRALAQLPDERLATATEMRQALRVANQSNASDHSGASAVALARTNVGQILLPLASGDRSTLVAQATVAAAVWLRLRTAWTARIALGCLLLASVVLTYWLLTRSPGSVVSEPPSMDAAAVRSGSPMLAPTTFVEVMGYYLRAESDSGRTERIVGAEPVVKGKWVKFHFVLNRQGYLYMIAPGDRGDRETFLTMQPNLPWGVRSNRLEAGADYTFPPRRDKWIEVAHGSGSRIYTIIFAPKPLNQAGFLAGAAGRELTAAEEGELAELQKQYGQQVRLETRGNKSIVEVSADRASDTPLMFEINLRRKGSQEGSKR